MNRHPQAKFCDGAVDCSDRSDELFCDAPCDAGQFQCAHPRSCVLSEWRCDGEWDCADGSDEDGCYGPGGASGRELQVGILFSFKKLVS